MTEQIPAYGLWSLVVLNSAIFIIFAFSFFKPQTKRDWRSFGAFSAFLVALFTEMYGFPLTIYLLSGWLQARFPGINWFSHDAGHLPEMLFGWQASPHFGPFHIVSLLLIGAGFILLSAAWRVLYQAQRNRTLAQAGPYAKVRHPQYVGFVLIMLGFLFQWPTLLTLAMFPVLVVMYWRLALREEREAEAEFGEAYRRYAADVPAFFPKLGLLGSDKLRKLGIFALILGAGAAAQLLLVDNGAATLVLSQQEELDQRNQVISQAPGGISACAHHPDQQNFTEADLPPRNCELIQPGHEEEPMRAAMKPTNAEKPGFLRNAKDLADRSGP